MQKTLLRHRRLGFAVALSLAAALVPISAYAHPGHLTSAGFPTGLLHPWTGLDHMAAMLAAGLWATLMRNQSIPAMLCASVVGIVAGSLLGAFPDILSSGELITTLSVIVIGLFAALPGQARKSFAVILVGLFCLFHGYVHTAEIPREVSQLAFSGGFLISMLALQLLGVVIGTTLSSRELLARSAGAFCSALGLALLFAG